jgi:diaminohydroxyphosphoribosylaminopyrimidine deaminase/5-amino-6-(5-phosphoribosylamino)uracil reductase
LISSIPKSNSKSLTDIEANPFDVEMSRRALELAAAGKGLVSPNPLVGCVVVSKSGEIVGEGAYAYDAIAHAEVIALQQAGDKAKGGTAYVSLEPHSHKGRTAPCTKALIRAGIKRVVAPVEDPNPLVAGRGFRELVEHGIEVVTGILAPDAQKLNEKFFVWHEKNRPFVHLKLAMSVDGRISLSNSVSTTISDPAAVSRVHDIRHDNDAILIGGNTAFVDDPSLTDRSGQKRRRPLVRIVLDNRLRLPLESKLVTTALSTPTIVFSGSENRDRRKELIDRGVDVPDIDARDLRSVLSYLREKDLQSVLVEGGTNVAGAFLDARAVDKVTFMMAPIIIGGSEAPVAVGGHGARSLIDAARLEELTISKFGEDIELTGYPRKSE